MVRHTWRSRANIAMDFPTITITAVTRPLSTLAEFFSRRSKDREVPPILWERLRNAGIDTENQQVRAAVERTWQLSKE
jgi:hypothetical protein